MDLTLLQWIQQWINCQAHMQTEDQLINIPCIDPLTIDPALPAVASSHGEPWNILTTSYDDFMTGNIFRIKSYHFTCGCWYKNETTTDPCTFSFAQEYIGASVYWIR